MIKILFFLLFFISNFSFAADVYLSWDQPYSDTRYELHSGLAEDGCPFKWKRVVSLHNQTQYTVKGVSESEAVYFKLTAYDAKKYPVQPWVYVRAWLYCYDCLDVGRGYPQAQRVEETRMPIFCGE